MEDAATSHPTAQWFHLPISFRLVVNQSSFVFLWECGRERVRDRIKIRARMCSCEIFICWQGWAIFISFNFYQVQNIGQLFAVKLRKQDVLEFKPDLEIIFSLRILQDHCVYYFWLCRNVWHELWILKYMMFQGSFVFCERFLKSWYLWQYFVLSRCSCDSLFFLK